jgi:hypothetical protein
MKQREVVPRARRYQGRLYDAIISVFGKHVPSFIFEFYLIACILVPM